MTVFWRPKSTYTRLIETESDNDTLGAIHLYKECEDWKQIRVIQLLSTDDTSALADMEHGRFHDDSHPQTQAPPESDRLSTIPEGTEETASTRDSLDTYLLHHDPRLRQRLETVRDDFTSPLPTTTELLEDTGDRLPLALMIPDYFPTTILPQLTDNNASFVELSIM